eukprot:TRINITY_DN13666_c1_g1_i1.p2 TRINITY_DN13666_c1_g1~~TRINITY_DN13666_c1_g1_i1.p2  ORF type:complete len:128 (+),score=7.97 TRINITY_DN13666_c1_g1_i1:445-828(+)
MFLLTSLDSFQFEPLPPKTPSFLLPPSTKPGIYTSHFFMLPHTPLLSFLPPCCQLITFSLISPFPFLIHPTKSYLSACLFLCISSLLSHCVICVSLSCPGHICPVLASIPSVHLPSQFTTNKQQSVI